MMILLRTRAMNYISKIIRKIVQLLFRATRNVVLPSYLCDKTNKNRIIMDMTKKFYEETVEELKKEGLKDSTQ